MRKKGGFFPLILQAWQYLLSKKKQLLYYYIILRSIININVIYLSKFESGVSLVEFIERNTKDKIEKLKAIIWFIKYGYINKAKKFQKDLKSNYLILMNLSWFIIWYDIYIIIEKYNTIIYIKID